MAKDYVEPPKIQMETSTQKFNTDDADFADNKDAASSFGAANTVDAVVAHDSDATNITAAMTANANKVTEVEELNTVNQSWLQEENVRLKRRGRSKRHYKNRCTKLIV